MGDLNLGPHIQVELSGPSPELVIIFGKFQKLGVGHFGGENDKLVMEVAPIFFHVLSSTLDLRCTCKVRKKSWGANSRIPGSNLKNPKFREKIPQKLGEGGGRPVLKIK